MDLIDIYIQEVTRRLPEKDRDDVSMELRSTIEDMLPDDYNEGDIKEALAKLGNPAVLANGYMDRPMHLIGPRYFEIYVSLLKMILPIAIVISIISTVAEHLINYGGGTELNLMIDTVVNLIVRGIVGSFEVILQFFFWITVIFAIIERADVNKGSAPVTPRSKQWTPDDLKKLAYIPKKRSISKVDVFGSLLWTAIWTSLYFYADHYVGVYLGSENGVQLQYPTFNQGVLLQYWPLVLILAGLEVALALYKYIAGQWTKGLAIFNMAVQLIDIIIMIVIILNPNLLNPGFIAYIADLFIVSTEGVSTSIVGGVIFIFIFFGALSVYEGFRKAKIR
ncbi:HAAS signaling domain-containing protein [Paenibacillus sp. GM2]|uniref:HAAS signaling domain-containing protein n=1 Tax=Paenibacillus sp. GM2 TaxID=1622070 RepID=UPI00083836C9|nr:hypothetical protein [Paenibacillus sp. GM2]